MHPPEFIVKKLQEIHPHVRLGWVGRDRGPDEDLNKGHFALLQLYHSRDASRTFFGDPWGDRGPVFGKPFDKLSREPRYLAELTPEDVFSGRVIALLKRWMRPMKDRYMESAKAKGASYKSSIDDVAGQMGEEMWWRANRADSPRPIPVAKKFLTEEDKKLLSGESEENIAETFTKLPANSQPMT